MKVLMLAAGTGERLFGADDSAPPKALLEFDGKTLLRRHVEVMREPSVDELVLVVGYRADLVEQELRRIGAGSLVRTIFNPHFDKGALVSLWSARDCLRGGEDLIFMDSDVLYDPALLERLIASPSANCLLFDANFVPGEDPVMVCLSGGAVVEFGKQVAGEFEVVGEWPGFLRLGASTAALLADAVEAALAAGDLMASYEPAMREVILGSPPLPFAIEDVSDLAWIEIDFPEDLERARAEVMSRLRASRSSGTPAEPPPQPLERRA